MSRIVIICEGPTEQAFVKTNLLIPFINRGITIQYPLIKASRGGIVNWQTLREQITTHLKADRGAYVTTFIDYYGMYSKHAFPGWEMAHSIVDINRRIGALESGMSTDIDPDLRYRFIPYLQLHEFEGLLFNDIQLFYNQIPIQDLVGIEELHETFATYENPEMINNSRETSPSHRLQRIIRGYNKVVYGDILSEAIGLPRIREKSPRFNHWIGTMENCQPLR